MNYYPPNNKDYRLPSSVLPPLLVKIHGGPTSQASTSFNVLYQYWCSRGEKLSSFVTFWWLSSPEVFFHCFLTHPGFPIERTMACSASHHQEKVCSLGGGGLVEVGVGGRHLTKSSQASAILFECGFHCWKSSESLRSIVTKLYWTQTSAGFAIADVNYGGSTGYGRAYRWAIIFPRNWCTILLDVATIIVQILHHKTPLSRPAHEFSLIWTQIHCFLLKLQARLMVAKSWSCEDFGVSWSQAKIDRQLGHCGCWRLCKCGKLSSKGGQSWRQEALYWWRQCWGWAHHRILISSECARQQYITVVARIQGISCFADQPPSGWIQAALALNCNCRSVNEYECLWQVTQPWLPLLLGELLSFFPALLPLHPHLPSWSYQF